MEDNKKDTPAYYAILTAEVRYDKRLTPNAKLLYAEITALANQKGFCWSSNSYFAELYGVSVTSVSKWISQLIEYNYLSSKMIYKEGSKEILYRYLSLVKDPIEEKLNTPIEEKLKDNTTLTNTTVNIDENENICPYELLKDRIGSKESDGWRDAFYMQFKLKDKSLSKIVDEFILHRRLTKENPPKTLQEFKTHLKHWCSKVDRIGNLNEYKKVKVREKGGI